MWTVARLGRDLDRFGIALFDVVGNNGVVGAGSVYCGETRPTSIERSAAPWNRVGESAASEVRRLVMIV